MRLLIDQPPLRLQHIARSDLRFQRMLVQDFHASNGSFRAVYSNPNPSALGRPETSANGGAACLPIFSHAGGKRTACVIVRPADSDQTHVEALENVLDHE